MVLALDTSSEELCVRSFLSISDINNSRKSQFFSALFQAFNAHGIDKLDVTMKDITGKLDDGISKFKKKTMRQP